MTANVSPPTGRRPAARLLSALKWLIETPTSVPEVEHRRAQLLSGLLLALILSVGFGLLTLIVVSALAPQFSSEEIMPVVGLGTLLFVLAYGLNRRGFYWLAAVITILIPAVGTWVMVLAGSDNIINVLYVLVSVILASMLLSRRATVVLAIGHLLIFALVPAAIPDVDVRILLSALFFVGFLSLCIVVAAGLRQRDLAQIEQQTRQLADSEERYRRIVETAQEGIWVCDAGARTTYVNRHMAEMLGCSEADMLGQPVYVFMDVAAGREAESILTSLTRGSAARYDFRFQRTDGADVWVIVSAQPMHDAHGRFLGVLSLITDITERRRADEALRQSEERLQLVAWATRDAIWDWDVATGEVWWSEGLQKLFYYPVDTPTRPVRWRAEHIHPHDKDKVLSSIQSALAGGGQFWSKEYRYRRADGTYANVFDRAYILHDAQGKPKRMIGAMIDITARKQAEEALQESESRYRAVTESASDAILSADADGKIIFWNRGASGIFGYSEGEIVGLPITLLMPERYRAAHQSGIARVTGGGETHLLGKTTELHGLRKDGTEFPLEISIAVWETEQGKFYSGIVRDITGRRQVEAVLREVNQQLTRGLNELGQRNREIALLNELGGLLQSCETVEDAYQRVGQQAPRLFPDEAGALYILHPAEGRVEAVAAWGNTPPGPASFEVDDCLALQRGRMHRATESQTGLACRHADPARASLCVPVTAQTEVLGLLHLQSSTDPGAGPVLGEARQHLAQTVAESVGLALVNLRLRETLRQQSIRDSLTGLFNRRYLEETLAREIVRAARSQLPVGVIMLDLDHFKKFNDTFGHEAGDTLLRELAGLLLKHVRGSDVACRYGGEEFILILPEAPLAVTAQRAQQLCDAVAHLQVHHRDEPLGSVTLSIGVAVYPEHGQTADVVLRSADAALYRAKRDGRNRVITAG